MKIFVTLLASIFASIAHAVPISCDVSSEGIVQIEMTVPHPNHALVHRPTGETVWIQTSPKFVHKQIDTFNQLSSWSITSKSKGTVWVDGKPTVQPIIKGKGRYHLYIAENPETEKANTYFIECYFKIDDKNFYRTP